MKHSFSITRLSVLFLFVFLYHHHQKIIYMFLFLSFLLSFSCFYWFAFISFHLKIHQQSRESIAHSIHNKYARQIIEILKGLLFVCMFIFPAPTNDLNEPNNTSINSNSSTTSNHYFQWATHKHTHTHKITSTKGISIIRDHFYVMYLLVCGLKKCVTKKQNCNTNNNQTFVFCWSKFLFFLALSLKFHHAHTNTCKQPCFFFSSLWSTKTFHIDIIQWQFSHIVQKSIPLNISILRFIYLSLCIMHAHVYSIT